MDSLTRVNLVEKIAVNVILALACIGLIIGILYFNVKNDTRKRLKWTEEATAIIREEAVGYGFAEWRVTNSVGGTGFFWKTNLVDTYTE